MKNDFYLECISFLLVGLFTYAAVSKALDYSNFAMQLGKSPFIGNYATPLSWLVPSVELLLVLALIFHPLRLVGLVASLFLLSCFTCYLGAMLYFSYYLPCSCGGVLGRIGWKAHIWFNIFFVLLSACGIILHPPVSPYKLFYAHKTSE